MNQTTTPTSTTTPSRAHLAAMVLGVTALLTLIVTAFAWPASEIAPRELPVAAVGPAEAVAGFENGTAALGDDALDVIAMDSRAAAVTAIEERDVSAAFVWHPRGRRAADRLGRQPGRGADDAADRGPARRGAPRAAARDDHGRRRRSPRMTRAAWSSAPARSRSSSAACSPAWSWRCGCAAGGTRSWRPSASPPAAAWPSWACSRAGSARWTAATGRTQASSSLGIAAIGLTLVGLRRAIGMAGLPLGALTILLLGNPLSGVTSAPELLPTGWSTLGQLLPPGATGTALRSTAFFDGAGAGLPLLVLSSGCWPGRHSPSCPGGVRRSTRPSRRRPSSSPPEPGRAAGNGARAVTPSGVTALAACLVDRSAGLAVRGVLAAARAELLQLHAVGVVAPVLLGDVVALLAVHAGERDLGANVGALAGHGKSFCRMRVAEIV